MKSGFGEFVYVHCACYCEDEDEQGEGVIGCCIGSGCHGFFVLSR